jgi:hypothetical protein
MQGLEHTKYTGFQIYTTCSYCYMRTIRKVTLGELLTKQAMRKENLIIYKKYTLQLLFNVVTTRTEALMVSGNKFLYACVKEVCCL